MKEIYLNKSSYQKADKIKCICVTRASGYPSIQSVAEGAESGGGDYSLRGGINIK
jgi:hypothetical protein